MFIWKVKNEQCSTDLYELWQQLIHMNKESKIYKLFFIKFLDFCPFLPIFILIYLINSTFLLHNWKILLSNFLLLGGHLHNKISFLEHFENFQWHFWSCLNFQDFGLNNQTMKTDWISANFWQIFNFSVPKSIYFLSEVEWKPNWVH